jgi:hypothetical protein
MNLPKVTFGIIVLNGEPFTRYCLRALYPFAHEIIVVEGAVAAAAGIASPDGHSRDETLQTLFRMQAEEDPENKIRIITRDGFWSEKDELSQAYAETATGDYLWQVDIDEFYQPDDMHFVLKMLADSPEIAGASFKQTTFWGGFDYVADSWFFSRDFQECPRVFRWGKGYRYVSHRPVTIHDSQGRNLAEQPWIHGDELARRNIFFYHYSLVFPKQVLEKCRYYSRASWAEHARLAEMWAQETFFHLKRPFRVHNVYAYPSWLERFQGTHPPQIQQLQADFKSGRFTLEIRRTDDIEALLRSPMYRAGRALLKLWEPYDRKLYASNRYVWMRNIIQISCSTLGKFRRILG